MTLFTAERISKRFDDTIIVVDVSFAILSHHRIGLVGRNGSGKTTLFEIVAGRITPDSGTLNKAKATKIDYVEQEKEEYLHLSLFDYVLGARGDLIEMHGRIADLEKRLESSPDDEKSIDRLGKLQLEFEAKDGFRFESEVKIILAGLGFDTGRFSDRLQNFSGGEKNRAGLARALAGDGNLLLLDEPTNHLDIESTRWLEDYLSSLQKACLIVSHDRAFLNATVKSVWEINQGKIDSYTGGFEKFLQERADRRRLQQHHFQHQQEEIKKIEEFIRRNMAGQKTKQAQSKLKYLNRLKRLEPPKVDQSASSVKMESSGRSYAHVLSIDNVTLGYGTEPVVEEVKCDIYRGDKVGLIGRNGSGKSTLLKSLIGELATISGEISIGNNVDVAYFDQELTELDNESTVIDSLWEKEPSAEGGKIRSYLARYGFSGDDSFKKVSALSGGEKTKLSLARLLYHPANFILFDEPTNHLDIDSRLTLEQALREFEGSCLIVSHDRYFLDAVVNRILHVDDGRVKSYEGNYTYFEERTSDKNEKRETTTSQGKEAYLSFKEKSRLRSRLKKKLQSARELATELERELEEVVEELADTIPRDDWEKLQERSKAKSQLEESILNTYDEIERLEKDQIDESD